MDWLVSQGAARPACYLVQTRNHYLTAVGTDVLVQIKPLPSLGAGLENKAGDGRLLSFGKGPLQNNTCRSLISWQRCGGLQFIPPRWRIWCRENKKELQSISLICSAGKIKLDQRKLLQPLMLNLQNVSGIRARSTVFCNLTNKKHIVTFMKAYTSWNHWEHLYGWKLLLHIGNN